MLAALISLLAFAIIIPVKEIDLLRKLDHENIIRFQASFIGEDREGAECLYIVLELADAGDLNVLLRVGGGLAAAVAQLLNGG